MPSKSERNPKRLTFLGRPIAENPAVAPARALTDERKRRTFASSGLSFRRYNAEIYEPWLKRRYEEDVEPFVKQHPESAFNQYLTETGRRFVLDHDDMAAARARQLDKIREKGDSVAYLMCVWQDMGRITREDTVLSVWEDQCVRAERGGYIWTREDCPELTLEWAIGSDEQGIPNWIKLWESQGQTAEEKKMALEGDDALRYRHLPHSKWDRVNGVLEVQNASVPLKASIRAFVHDGIARRNLGLRQFVYELLAAILNIEVKVPAIEQSEKHADEKDEEEMLENLRAQGVSVQLSSGGDYKVCVQCCVPVSTELNCARCKNKVNRIMRYCSADCQREHWPVHKKTCGRPLTDSLPVPSLVSTGAGGPSTQPHAAETSLASTLDRLKISSATRASRLKSAALDALDGMRMACWVYFDGDPDRFDPRNGSYLALGVDVPVQTGSTRLEVRNIVRTISLEFLSDETTDDRLLDILVVVSDLIHGNSEKKRAQQARWLAMLTGRQGAAVNQFVNHEYHTRCEKARRMISTDANYRALKTYIDQEDSATSYYMTEWDQIRNDLENDPDTIWCTRDPTHPDVNVLEGCMRIEGPILEGKHANSEFSNGGTDPLALVRFVRHNFSFRLLDNVDSDNLTQKLINVSTLLLILTENAAPRCKRWIFCQVLRRDFNLSNCELPPEEQLKDTIELERAMANTEDDEFWRMVRKSIEVMGDQPKIPESSFPPLTWPPTSSARIPRIRMTAKAATNTATRALVNANDGQDNSNQKKAKKNKKKKKKKKPKTEEAAELDV